MWDLKKKLSSFVFIFILVTCSIQVFCATSSTTTGTDAQALPYQVGQWLPSDQRKLEDWEYPLILETANPADETPLFPVIQEFKELIENDPEIFMLFTQMFEQIPDDPLYANDPIGNPQIRNYMHLLRFMNRVLTQAPKFDKTGFVGFPINAVLNWPMDTAAGLTVFLNEKVNQQLKKILNQWGVFLRSPDSLYVLDDDPETGWFGQNALEAMPNFVEEFVCDPNLPYYGFTSWDDFFTRRFREGRRAVESPEDPTIIANACESAPFMLATDVQLRDNFWIKSQPYSLYHLMAGDPLAKSFEGGSVYQAFLSALSYHRWHSPVDGRIVKTTVVDGSYFSESPSVGFDALAPNDSQSYITHVAARAIIFIEADNPDIGLMCAVFVGMAEVSSCEITVYEGQHVKKGDQLGMFHFGGSTHALIFRSGVNLEFDLHGQIPSLDSENIPVRSKIAKVVQK